MSLHFPGQAASAYPGQAASTAATHLTDTVFLTLHSVWHFVIPVIFLKGHCVSLISSISPCFGNVLQSKPYWSTCFFLKAFLHVFIFLCVSRQLVWASALFSYHTGPGNLSRVTRLGGKSLYLQSHLWVLFCHPFSLLLSLLWVPSSRPLPRSAFIMLTSFLPSFSCSWASHLELTWVLNKCSFHIYFLCLTQVLAYGDKLIQFVILLPQLPKCISLSCLWWLIMLYFSYSLWW